MSDFRLRAVLQAGDLPGKVRELERNYQQLKKELENSPWSRFQQVMMEHVRENGELGETLTEEEFQRLQQMHTMSAAERKVCVLGNGKKSELSCVYMLGVRKGS